MSDYAYIVGATKSYTPELCAELNSLSFIGNKEDVHVLGIELEDSFTSQFNKLGYNVFLHDISEQEWQEAHGRSEIVCRKRYWYAADIGEKHEYKSICILDADMIFVRNPINYFEIAAKTGLVLCAVKEQKQSYNDPHHQFKGQWIMPEGFVPEMDLCNCPLFVDTKVWGQAMKESYEIFIDGFPIDNFKGPDMAAIQLKLCQYGAEGRTIGLPNNQWLGTNEQFLKSYSRVVSDYGSLKTETGTPIYSYHGQYFYPRWRNVQLMNRDHCARGYLKASGESLQASNNLAKGAMQCLYERFKAMLDWKIVIPKMNYRHPEKETGFLDIIGEDDLKG